MHRSTGNTDRPGGTSSDNVDSSTYIRTGDSIGFGTSTTTGRIVKHYLSTGFGTQYCTVLLEPSDDQEPTVIWRHMFEVFDAISPHAIHGWNEKESQVKGCRVLLYGQAILLKMASGKYLRCLPHHAGRVGKYKMNDFHSHYLIGSSTPNQKAQADEYCWFVLRPATTQRSEGEKVKAGDDVHLVNVGTGRYLSLPHERPVAYNTNSTSLSIDFDDDTFTDIPVATFSPWTWIIDIIRSSAANAGLLNGYINAGDPIQLKVAHRDDELMSIPLSSLEDPLAVNDAKRMVYFEDKSVKLELRSLWLVMLSGVSYGRAFIEYGQPFRLRHMVSGMYLGVDQNHQLVLVDGKNAHRDTCCFCFVKKGSPVPPINYKREGMGTPTIKLGESEVSLYHISSKLWVTLELMGPSLRRLRTGFSGPPRALLSEEPHGFSFTTLKAMHIALSAIVCNELETVMLAFSEAMRRIQGQPTNDKSIKSIKESAEEKTLAKLNESLGFLIPPNKEIMDIHNYQDMLMKLRNRQTRFLNHGTANMVFALLRKTVSHYGHNVTSNGLKIQQALCRILANVVKGNRLACRRFANRESISNMFELINNSSLLHPMLEVMDCLLEESPEVLLSLTEENVTHLFTLLYCHGRDDKVMSLLGRLPVCQGVAMREKQLQICHLLQDSHQLLLHTSLLPKLYSMYANVFVSSKDIVDATKLYFEVQSTKSEATGTKPYIRIGFVQYLNFLPYPKSKGSMATQGGIGDDASSVSFDGDHIWINGEKYGHQSIPLARGLFRKQSSFGKDDKQHVTVYGCCLDLEKGTLMFTLNGQLFPLQVNFHLNENTIAVPAVSFTGGVKNARLCFGSDYGDLYFAPPDGYQPLSHFIEQKANGEKEKICLYPFVCVGDSNERILNGPMQYNDSVWFHPSVPDLTNVIIPSRLHQLINDLAVEFHDSWAVSQIDLGHSSPYLTAFRHLPKDIQLQRIQEGRNLIATLISLGCRISSTDTHSISHQDLPDDPYCQSNGFKPCPLELLDDLPVSLQSLITQLSELEHNKWSKERMSEGWKYGVTTRPQVMQDCCLVPYQCLPLEIKRKYELGVKKNLLVLSSLGYSVQSPPVDHLKGDLGHTLVPFRTFRGQFLNYCTGSGKWYFKVKLLKGRMSRIGWAIPRYSSSSLLGSDSFSYAIDGHNVVKWHDGLSENFGHILEEGDEITCLLDLDEGTMSFACNDKLLLSLTHESGIAFSNLPRNELYVPAVSVFMGEQVRMILTSIKEKETSSSRNITAGYRPIENDIRVRIPLWYSHVSHQFKDITSSHSYLKITKTKEDELTVNSNEAKLTCLRLNMGVEVTLDKRRDKDNLQVEEREGGLEENQDDDGEKYSFSVTLPAGEAPSTVYFGWAREDFLYDPKDFHTHSDDLILNASATIEPISDSDPLGDTTFEEFEEIGVKDREDFSSKGNTMKDGIKRRMNANSVTSTKKRRSQLESIEEWSLEDDDEENTSFRVIGKERVLGKHQCIAYLLKMSALLRVDESVYLATDTQVDCVLNPSTGLMNFSCLSYSKNAVFEFRVKAPGRLFPILITKPKYLKIGSFSFAPAKGCQPLVKALVGKYYKDTFPNLLPSMKLMSISDSCWYQMDDRSSSYPTKSSLSIPNMPSYDIMHLCLPQEGNVMRLTELIESPSLYSFHVETLKTYRACCMHDNSKAAEMVNKIVSWKELIHSIKSSYWSYHLVTESFNLINTLYLKHKVLEYRLIRQDSIFASDCIACSTPPPSSSNGRRRSSNTLLSHKVTVCCDSEREWISSCHYHQLSVLKDITFQVLDSVILADVMTCRMLSAEYTNCLFLPLLKAVDCFLVLGMLQDSERLLSLLHPSLAPPGHKANFYLLTMPTKDPQIQSVLCDILDHLCDAQLQGRLDHVIEFANEFVGELQEDQRKRVMESDPNQFLSPLVIQEINTPTEKQLNTLLSFSSDSCLTSQSLRDSLQSFHTDLSSHCSGIPSSLNQTTDLSSFQKLSKLVSLVTVRSNSSESENSPDASNLHKLRDVIISTVLRWSRSTISDIKMAEKTYNLLYRQFNESEMLRKAIQRTYIVEQYSAFSSGEISKFRSALGKMRKMLVVGFGEEEEPVFQELLHELSTCDLFQRHPDLLRFAGVHSLVINVMKSYFSFSETLSNAFPSSFGTESNGFVGMTQTLKLAVSDEGFADIVEDCCKFLCSFAQTSHQNQIALSEHLQYLLDQCLIFSDQVASNSTNPLDVAIATISNNLYLVMTLSTEGILHKVVQLMHKMMKYEDEVNPANKTISSPIHKMSVLYDAMPMEWLPTGAEKCLKFLQAAVYVNGETIEENAAAIIRLLIQQPDCLGPCYINQHLSLVKMFSSCFSQINSLKSAKKPKRLTRANSRLTDTIVRLASETELPQISQSDYRQRSLHRSSTLNLFYRQLNGLTSELTVSFYTLLVRVLGLCAPSIDKGKNFSCTRKVQYSTEHILPFLRTLIGLEDLRDLLSLPMDVMPPTHKEALMVFLDRVYSSGDKRLVLDLIREAFLPDLKATIHKAKKTKYDAFVYLRYISCHVLPYLEHQSSTLDLLSEFPLLLTLIHQVYQLIALATDSHRIKIEQFLITMTKALPPSSILKLLPMILDDIKDLSKPSFTVALKILTVHHSHHSRYYTTGSVIGRYKLCRPSHKERVYIALLFSWILKTLCHAKEASIAGIINQCLESLACAILPEILVPPLAELRALSVEAVTLSPSRISTPSSTPSPPLEDEGASLERADNNLLTYIDQIEFSSEYHAHVFEFAKYCHENWVYEKQQVNGWSYDHVSNPDTCHDNRLRPFEYISDEWRDKVIDEVKQVLQVLLFYGCVFNQGSSGGQLGSIPLKPKLICLFGANKRKVLRTITDDPDTWYSYEPLVVDLNQIELPLHALIIVSSANTIMNQLVLPPVEERGGTPSDFETYDPIRLMYYEKTKRKSYGLVEDFLKFMKVKGLIVANPFAAIPGSIQYTLSKTIDSKPFSLQLFECFLMILRYQCSCTDSYTCRCQSHKQEIFPAFCSYLNTHASYFNPNIEGEDRRLTFATLDEKIPLIKLFFEVHSYIGSHLDSFLISTSKTATVVPGEVTTSKGAVSWNTELQAIKERNQRLLKRLMSLSTSLIKVLDVSQFEVLEETKSFFSYVISTLESLGKSLDKIKSNQSNQFDKKLFLYVTHCLAPSLTALFRRCEHIVVSPVNGVVKSQFSDVFICIFSLVSNSVRVFIESDTLSIVGQCLSTVCLADSKFQVSRFKNHLGMLELKRAALLKISTQKISLVALVIAPVLTNLAIREAKNGSNVKVDKVLKLVLRILSEYQDNKEATWMKDLSCSVCHLASYCSVSVYKTHLIPLLMKMSDRGSRLWQEEQLVTSSLSIKECDLLIKQKQFEKRLKLYGQDLVSVLLFFLFFTEKNPSIVADLTNKTLFHHTALILNHSFTSQKFSSILNSCSTSFIQNVRGRKPERWNILISFAMTIIRHLPSSVFQFLHQLNPLFDQPSKSSTDIDQAILDLIKRLSITGKSYSRTGIDEKSNGRSYDQEKRKTFQVLMTYKSTPFVIQSFARVQRLMRQIVTPSLIVRERWRDAMSRKKREGIVACLKAVPFHRLKKHRAMNLFLQEYSSSWLSKCHSSNMENLCEEIIDKEDYYKEKQASSSVISLIHDKYVDPLEQLFSLLGMQASTGQWYGNSSVLYDCFANAVIETFQTMIDDAEELEGNSIYDNFESIRYQVVAKQGLLIKKRVPEMILAILTSSNGKLCPLVHITLKLGIVQLEGGNTSAQERIMQKVKSLGSEFWTSIAGLISHFGTLDWNIYEKSQIVVQDQTNIGERVFPTSDQVLALFRFLQLLCEGHNEGFQNLLRTQGSNAMSTNIVIATVDYLLKLQDSIRDFYWYHAKQDSLELPARETFLLSFKVAKQLFRTLTEYMQGPCVGNQEALAKSRFWDAMGGFLHVFVALQQKLFCYTSHMELLLELLGLQEEYFILLLAMLEGTTKVSAVGEHMLNMLHESDQFLKELITFYNIFIKLKDISSSKAFKEYDLNKDGLISYQEFEQAMRAQQFYTKSEIQYLMKLADTNKDGLLDYQEFTERFYQPTHKLGFHLCALIRQLSDTMPGNSKLKEIEKNCLKLSEYFEDNIGCIEMMGKSGNVERVYFHIKTSHALQWNDPAIKESRHDFLHSFNWTSQKEKLEEFMNFCEDTIFQMTYNDRMFNVEQEEREKRTDNLRKSQFPEAAQYNTRSIFSRAQTKLLSLGITNPGHVYLRAHSILSFIWFTLILGVIIAPFTHIVHYVRVLYDFCFYGGQGPLKYSSNNPSFLKQCLIKCFRPAQFYLPKTIYASKSLRGHLAHSYYTIKYCLVLTTILINFLILISIQADKNEELTSLNFSIHLHFVLSCLLMVSFWHLKVPLIIFQKEKSIARRLKKHKGKVTSDHFSFFDRLALRSPSFPGRFWDRQIKERVFDNSPPEDRTKLASVLGIVNKSKFDEVSRCEQLSNAITSVIDIRYQAWRIVMICFCDMTFRYHLGYCLLSLAGIKYNVFFFSLHLLELTLQSKTLVNVLRSLKINMKQLLMTLVVTSVVIYIYSAVAFSFFRKFYVQEVDSGYVRDNCGNMLTCFLFHIDHGLRSGGGIADVILSAFEDQVYLGRLVFDLTYFFVVIVILLAVFQGLIIDAFGELRKKDDLVLEELKNKCFICGLSLADFKNPHEFDTHVNRHHSLKNYMFFLLHLISKPDTEFTGQESMIWDLYLEQTWDFFPAGTCFQIQERRASDALAN